MEPGNTSTKQWHIAEWPALAWVETAIKLVAFGVGIVAFFRALSVGGFTLPEGARAASFVILAVLSLGLVFAIFDRIVEREIVAMGFVIVNNLGHWGMVTALASAADVAGHLMLFCVLMGLGDAVKLVFIWRHNYQVRDLPRAALYGLTAIYLAGYGIILFLEVVI